LKKFKNVLDYRLREVSESLMPKERQIETLKSQLQDTEAEFEVKLAEQQKLQAKVDSKEQKVNQLRAEVKQKEAMISEKEKYIAGFENELYSIAQTDPRTWTNSVKKLYHKYVQKERTAPTDKRGVEEITKQMGLVEKKITSFAVKSERAELACKVDTQRKTMENSLLIHELNELRYDKKSMESKLRNQELQLKALTTKVEKYEKVGSQKVPPSQELVALPQRQSSEGRIHRGVVSASRMSAEEKQRMAGLLKQVDVQEQELAMHKLELKVLRDQVTKLLGERKTLLGEDSTFFSDLEVATMTQLDQTRSDGALMPA
jgi:chromosome segregation ATPase